MAKRKAKAAPRKAISAPATVPQNDGEVARWVYEKYYRSQGITFDVGAIAALAKYLAELLSRPAKYQDQGTAWGQAQKAADRLLTYLDFTKRMPVKHPLHIRANMEQRAAIPPLLTLWNALHHGVLAPLAQARANDAFAPLPPIEREAVESLKLSAAELEEITVALKETDGVALMVEASKPDRDGWPPDGGWHFRPGQYGYDRQTFWLSGAAWKLLRALASPNRKFPLAELKDMTLGKDSPTGEKGMQTHLSLLRTTLRQNHGLDADADPIPRSGRGVDAVYWLDLSYRRKPSKRRIKRKLSAN